MEVMYKRRQLGLLQRFFWPPKWSKRTTHILAVAFFMIALPVYIFIGFQPAYDAEAANYPVLEIPSIDLKTPVKDLDLVNHQLETPATIAGAYSQNPHKTLIIGHSSTVFEDLHELMLSDQFSYDGNTYEVYKIETLKKENIDMRQILSASDTDTIIIMTCAGTPLADQDATHRLIAYATKITL